MEMNVLTIGTFDTPHMGHAAFLRKAARFGHLTVGVNTDAMVEGYKGTKPVFDLWERAALIRALGYQTAANDGPGRDLIRKHSPCVLVIGSDWLHRDYLTQIGCDVDDLERWGVTLVYVPYTTGISTTLLKERLHG